MVGFTCSPEDGGCDAGEGCDDEPFAAGDEGGRALEILAMVGLPNECLRPGQAQRGAASSPVGWRRLAFHIGKRPRYSLRSTWVVILEYSASRKFREEGASLTLPFVRVAIAHRRGGHPCPMFSRIDFAKAGWIFLAATSCGDPEPSGSDADALSPTASNTTTPSGNGTVPAVGPGAQQTDEPSPQPPPPATSSGPQAMPTPSMTPTMVMQMPSAVPTPVVTPGPVGGMGGGSPSPDGGAGGGVGGANGGAPSGGAGGDAMGGSGGSEPSGDKPPPSPSSGCGNTGDLGSSNSPLNVSGHQYYVKLPTNYDPDTPYPVLYVFNPTNNPINWAEQSAGFEQTEAKDKWIRVYPHPANSSAGWGSGDVDFFGPLHEAITSNFCVDEERAFATGESSGGDFSSILGCEYADLIRATAPCATKNVGGYPLNADQRQCTGQVGAVVIHGIRDNVVGTENGPLTRDFYKALNHCSDEEVPVEGYTDDQSNCVEFQGCDPGFPVFWCNHSDPNYSNTNHGWPAFAAPFLTDHFSEY